MDSTTDELLMLSVRDGQIDELAVLYERHRTPLLNFFVRLTGKVQVSEDLVHDVFLRMLKYRQTFKAGNRFTTWMYQVARNVHFDSWSRQQHEVPVEPAALDDHEEWASPEPSPDLMLTQSQETVLLQTALAQLPLEFREVLVLSRFQNLRYEEIATILDCGVGAVKMRVHRALKDLRARFTALTNEKAL